MKTYTFMETFECNSYLYDTTGFGGGSVDAGRKAAEGGGGDR